MTGSPDRSPAPRWGLVTTAKAPPRHVARFVAHHLELGAHRIHLFLDAPDPATEALLRGNPRLRVTRCDDAYWRRAGRERMTQHQLRQAFNATRTLRRAAGALDWLGHIDVDEFLLPDRPLGDILAGAPAESPALRIAPAELLAPEPGGPPAHFKLTHRAAGAPRAALEEIYPTFGMHLWGGFLSHVSGKLLVRPGIERARLGIHALLRDGQPIRARDPLAGVTLGHFHAESWEAFRDAFAFRRAHGSYRKHKEDPAKLGLADILAYLADTEGEAGLRTFFDEVCRDTPGLRARLGAHGMLLTRPLDLPGAVARVFGSRAA